MQIHPLKTKRLLQCVLAVLTSQGSLLWGQELRGPTVVVLTVSTRLGLCLVKWNLFCLQCYFVQKPTKFTACNVEILLLLLCKNPVYVKVNVGVCYKIRQHSSDTNQIFFLLFCFPFRN